MNAIDEIYKVSLFYGHRRILRDLREDYDLDIDKKRTISLMKDMGLEAVYPRKKLNLSDPNALHKKFPYLLNGLPIVRPNHVWGTGITYIRIKNGFAYLTAILDWFSRYVIARKLAPTLETVYSVQALKQALEITTAEIHNSDQGVQYTDKDYTAVLEENKIRISMDGTRAVHG